LILFVGESVLRAVPEAGAVPFTTVSAALEYAGYVLSYVIVELNCTGVLTTAPDVALEVVETE